MPRTNVYCDQCEKHIGDEKLTWFSDAEKDLDFCSEDCYSKWVRGCNAQEWINQKYPTKEEKEQVKELNISKKNLVGELALNDFTNLESLDCSHNQLTNLDLSACQQLKMLICYNNLLTSFDYAQLNPEKLIWLDISSNNLSLQELVALSQFVNLIGLHVGNSSPENINKGIYNRFSGSLAPLRDLNKLYSLNISNTDLNNGIEYLPESLSGFNKAGEEKVLYSAKERSNCKLQEIEPQLASFVNWREWGFGWGELCFSFKESILWVRIGLTVNDYEFADYLQREKKLSPQEAKEYLEGLRDEYEVWSWKNLHQKFTPELRREWEDCDFDAEQTKEWISIGLEPKDYGYTQWLKNIKDKNAKWVKEYGDEKELREEYKKHISEIANSSQFGKKVHNELRKRAKLILDNPNFDLKAKEYARELIKMQNEENEEYEDGVCSECYKPNTSYNWCRKCNAKHFIQEFDKWTSGNPEVNAFIKQYQLRGDKCIEWIPYERFANVKYLAEGGFGKIYKAKWIDGFVMSWSIKDEKWKRNSNSHVVLKSLNGSQDALSDFLREAANHKLFKAGHVTRCYGISQNPETRDYLMVINYMKGGNLRQYLSSYYNRTNFSTKLSHLENIARGLEQIHEQGLIHKDLHPGNLLNSSRSGAAFYITDLGLCKPVNENEINKGKIYGVLPYIAPEVLRGQPYTQAADIYSFGMVTYEIFTGLPPFYDMAHGEQLASKICQGLRPSLDVKLPQSIKSLVTNCWSSDSLTRPTISKVIEISSDWLDGKDTETYYHEVLEAAKFNKELSSKRNSYHVHPQVSYFSKPISTQQIAELAKKLQESEQVSSQLNEIAENIKEIEEKIKCFKKSLNSELAEPIDNFVQARKKMINNREDKEAKTEVGNLEEQLEKKGLVTEDIEKLIKCCEKLVILEQQLEQPQAQIEIPTNN